MAAQMPGPNPVVRYEDEMRRLYGGAIGRPVESLVTPALVLDLPAAKRNIAAMAAALETKPAEIRPHIKVHKSPQLSALQVEAGAIGLSVATVWEAIALAWWGLDDLFVVNTVSHADKVRALVELARDKRIFVAVDELANAESLSAAAGAAGSELGVLIEVDTGMDRAGVDTVKEAISLAESIQRLAGLRLEGITGYEGHCSLEPDEDRRRAKHRDAMDKFLEVADSLENGGIPCPIRSAGGTATWDLTASRPGITEIQAGSYVVMDTFHGAMVRDFENALTVATTVISRAHDRLIVDAGNKSVGIGGGPRLMAPDIAALRFDEEHGIFVAPDSLEVAVGTALRLIPGYAPATVNLYDFYYVADDGVVVDIWPVFPRGPGHHGLLTASGRAQ
ncbi:MAG: hypothetical protein JWM85_3091 [Acidimicrobiaceae bacterium]|nr:hypothetical protein [Acidimicrobiaceae bacterium]